MSFIKGCQIIDGPMMVNVIITWAKKHTKRLLFLKVDIEKAFDSLSWSFLISIMGQVGFSIKWRNWICALASVLVNGSLTKEFKLEKGLCQGDPLSPFLFILALEAFGVAILEDKINISHLQFADDALILGDWSMANAKNLSRILTCFHLASGLKVNFNKSKLFGIGVTDNEINIVASSNDCIASYFLCLYLGLPIGARMSRCINWIPLVERFQKQLSKWKVNSLSFGGRLTLNKSVLGSLGVYYFSTFKSPKKSINKLEGIRRRFFENGGLGIGSLMESNQSLLAKWWWRFCVEKKIIWRKVIRSIHGPTSGMLNPFDLKQSSGTWSQIVNLKDYLNFIKINLPLLFKKKIGNGKSTRFWHDNWLGGKTLREAFMLLYQLETKKDCYVFERHGSVLQNSHTSHGSIQVLGPISQPIISRINDGLVTPWAWRRRPYSLAQILELTDLQNLLTDLHLSMDQDSWEFTQGSMRIFSVNSMRKTISNTSVDPTSQQTRWNKLLPSKVNILAWCIANKRLLTKANLDKRWIDLDLVLCPMCNNDIEMESHILVSCPTAQAM
ncbi:putative RNA-directed DNA polymerase [Tanacetum coccineum]|uniref:RNA-directed DNA polymerase n=1 Tax=Tanacetum coccineum TaxID=301880 RepID=A0ABQ5EJE4_9ASTR